MGLEKDCFKSVTRSRTKRVIESAIARHSAVPLARMMREFSKTVRRSSDEPAESSRRPRAKKGPSTLPPPRPGQSRSFLSRVESPAGFEVLFEHLDDVYFFVKDADGAFVRASRSFCELVGRRREADVIGLTDSELFPAELAENYMRDDREVLRSRKPMVDKLELVRSAHGSIDWCCTTRVPLLDKRGVAIGICGVMRDLKKLQASSARGLAWAPVLESILNDYAQPLSTTQLAAKVSLSVSQFNRQFRKQFHTTPRTYLTNVRLSAACHLLVSTDLPISDISLRTGFYDQSHFSNQFVRRRGLPPSQYRAKHAPSRASREP
jgi:PAS domain S-box-containing protein